MDTIPPFALKAALKQYRKDVPSVGTVTFETAEQFLKQPLLSVQKRRGASLPAAIQDHQPFRNHLRALCQWPSVRVGAPAFLFGGQP